MNRVNWTIVVVFGVVLLCAFLVGISVLGGFGGYAGYYRGSGMMGPGMMGRGGFGFAPFGWIGMLLMWLVPTGFFVLVALGVVWLVRVVGQPGRGQAPAAPTRTCPNCHRSAQADWHNCPYCGAALEQDAGPSPSQ
jgi:hypothetical protein